MLKETLSKAFRAGFLVGFLHFSGQINVTIPGKDFSLRLHRLQRQVRTIFESDFSSALVQFYRVFRVHYLVLLVQYVHQFVCGCHHVVNPLGHPP